MAGLSGLAELETRLRDYADHLKGKVLRDILLTSVQPLVNRAAAAAPSRTGALGRSMTAQSIPTANEAEAVVRVGPGRPEGSHGILLEVGTIYMTARPFLGSAFEASEQEITDILENEIDEVLNALGR